MEGRRRGVPLRVRELAVLVILVCGSVLVGVAPVARADHGSIPWTTPSPLTVSALDELAPSLIYNGSRGLYLVATAHDSAGSSTNLTFIVQADSGPYGQPQYLYASRPNDVIGGMGTVSGPQPVSLASDSEGRVFVAWTRAAPYTAGNNDDVYMSVSLDHGHTWPTISRASAPNSVGLDNNPVVRTGPDGRVWVAYMQNWGLTYNVTVSSSTDHGSSFQGFVNVSSMPANQFPLGFDLQVDSGGRAHVVYSQCTGAFICSLYYRSSSDGTTWSAPLVLVQGSGGGATLYATSPSLTVVGSTLHLTWFDARTTAGSTPSIYYSRSTDRGATWTTPNPVNQGVTSPAGPARVAVSGDTVMVVWTGNFNGLSWAVSATDGSTWYPEQYTTFGNGYVYPTLAGDGNGTFHAVVAYYAGAGNHDLYEMAWNGPPDAPTSVAAAPSGANGLSVSWTAPPQEDVGAYRVYRSPDGSTYALIASVPASSRSYTDPDLADGTYWYKVTAVDLTGHESHDSVPASGTVGPSLQDQLNAALDQLAALRSDLATAEANATALQNQVNDLKAAQGTTTLLLVLLLVLVVVQTAILVFQFRRPRKPAASPPRPAPPEPSHPEDEL